MAKWRILVVDDHLVMRETIVFVINSEPDLEVCGEAEGIEEAIARCNSLRPDLALVDVSLKGDDGLDLVRRLQACAPPIATVVFSLHDEPFYIEEARDAGAGGYAVKSDGPQQMLACIRGVLDGGRHFSRLGPA
ncbi:MAG: response regulator transcription factor [Verrucomicrobia bacterium]|nr:response regulator transcription factor [Verrucomicrobiota bacterium]